MPEDRLEHALNHCQERAKTLKPLKKYKRKYVRRTKIQTKLPYRRLTDKQKAFKKAVDGGTDPAEAVKAIYTSKGGRGIENMLTEVKRNPVLAASIDNYTATMLKVGFTDEFEAKKLYAIADKTKKDSSPHIDRNTIIVFQDYRKSRGLDIARSETRSLNININLTEEMAEFWQRKQKKEEVIDV